MTNDEALMSFGFQHPADRRMHALRHSSFGFLSSFVIRHSSFLLVAFAAVLLLSTSSCGRGPDYPCVTVTGTVTIDGVPVPRGYITFSPAQQGRGPVVGAAIEAGQYRCESVPLGPHTVTFVAQAAEMEEFLEIVTGEKHLVPKDILPPAYGQGVPVTVEPGTPVHDFELVGGGAR